MRRVSLGLSLAPQLCPEAKAVICTAQHYPCHYASNSCSTLPRCQGQGTWILLERKLLVDVDDDLQNFGALLTQAFTNVTFTTGGSQPTDSRVLPTTMWFERIEYLDRLTGTEIARYHGDMMHLVLNTLPQEALDQIADIVNMCPKTGKVSGRQWENNAEQYFYLPLVHTWLNGMDLDLSTLRGDLEIRFYPRGSIFVAAQSAVNGQSAPAVPCTASLGEIRFITGCTQLPNGMRLGRNPQKMGKVTEQKYIDFVQYTAYGQKIKASDRLAIDLDQFAHHSGALFVFIRKSGDQTSYSYLGTDTNTYYPQYTYDTTGRLMTYDSFGDSATIDLEDVNGRSQLGEGTPIDERFFREETMGQLVRSSYLKSNSVYMIPFTNDPKAMLDGVMDGYKTFTGNRERLVINGGLAPVATTATFTVPTLGSWANTDTIRLYIKYDGAVVLTAVLDEDTAAWTKSGANSYAGKCTAAWTNINKALTASSFLRKKGVKLSFKHANDSMDFTSAQNVAVTYKDLNDQPLICDPEDLTRLSMEVVDMTTAEKVNEHYYCTAIVSGRRGVIDGLYDITIYSAYFKFIHEAGGSLEVASV
eukprot:g59637.t1